MLLWKARLRENCQSDTYQANVRQMSNNVYQITNAKNEMLNDCEISLHDLSDGLAWIAETWKYEGAQQICRAPEQYIDTCIRKPELQNRILPQTSRKCIFQCSSGDRQFSNELDNNKDQLRNSGAVVISHLGMRRGREPSRISFRKVARLFKRRKTRKAVKLYIRKYVPPSSVLKGMLCGYKLTRNHLFDECRRSKFTVFLTKGFVRRKLHFLVFWLRTFRHKKSAFM